MLGLTAPVADGARAAMAVFLPMPVVMAWRSFQQGMLIANKVTNNVLVGAVSRPVLCALLMALFLMLGQSTPGVVLGAAALVTVILVEGIILRFLILKGRYSWNRVFRPEEPGIATSYRAVFLFLLPLFA